MEPAATPTGTPIRKACNRCHAQKLSCRRFGDEPCERCIRLKTECRSSPSLRYRRQQQLQQLHMRREDIRQACPVTAGNVNSVASKPHSLLGIDYPSSATITPPSSSGEPCVPMGGLGHGGDINQADIACLSAATGAASATLNMVGFGFGIDPRLDTLFATSRAHRAEDRVLLQHGPPVERAVSAVTSLPPHTGQAPFYLGHARTSPTGLVSSAADPGQQLPYHTSYHLDQPPNSQPPYAAPLQQHNHPIPDQHHRSEFQFCTENSPISVTSPDHGRAIEQRRIISRHPQVASVAQIASWLGRLVEINKETWELAARVPYLVPVDGDKEVYIHASPRDSQPGQGVHCGFPLDQMFALSRKFLDVLKTPPAALVAGLSQEGFTGATISHQPQTKLSPATTPECQGEVEASQSSFAAGTPTDPGSVLLTLSAYVRLLELYRDVFRLVDHEILNSHTSGGHLEKFALCRLPDVSLGGIFPVASSPILQMTLAVRVADEFLNDLRTGMEMLELECPPLSLSSCSTLSPPGSSATCDEPATGLADVDTSFVHVAKQAMSEVKVVEARIRQELGIIRSKLESSSRH